MTVMLRVIMLAYSNQNNIPKPQIGYSEVGRCPNGIGKVHLQII